MQSGTTRRLTLDATVERSVIRRTLTGPCGGRRDFRGWLELNTALEAMLDTGADRAHTRQFDRRRWCAIGAASGHGPGLLPELHANLDQRAGGRQRSCDH